MLNSYLFIILSFISSCLWGQNLIAESVPRAYHIDKAREIEGYSPPNRIDIIPYRVRIRNALEAEASKWFKSEGHQYAEDANFEERFVTSLENIQPQIVDRIGELELYKIQGQCFFRAESLKYEIQFRGFSSFYVDMPLADVESFQANFHRLKFSDPKIHFDDNDQFILTRLTIYNPANQQQYVVEQDLPPNFKRSSFNISLPSITE